MKPKTPPTIEYEFRLKYGCYPFDYLSRLLKRGLTRVQAYAKLQENVDGVWKEMKANNKRQSAQQEDLI